MSAGGVDLSELESTLRRNARVKLFSRRQHFIIRPGARYRAHMARLATMLARDGVALEQDLVYSELPYNGVADCLPRAATS